jgi:RNA polymerase sigma factor (sigma-70 family)
MELARVMTEEPRPSAANPAIDLARLAAEERRRPSRPPVGDGPQHDATITPIHGTPVVTADGYTRTAGRDAEQSGDLADDLADEDERPRRPPVPFDPAVHGPTAFGDLYAAHHDRLVRLAYVLTGSREIAEDVVQDSFVRLYRHWGSALRPEGYIRQIVVNGCRSHHRRAGRERDKRAQLYVVETDIDRQSVELADVLLELPYKQRAAIVLRFYSDLSEVEIAEVLECRPGTVGSLIHRGLAKLRKAIE